MNSPPSESPGRPLTSEEVEAIDQGLERDWGITSRAWYPRDRVWGSGAPPHTAVFSEDPFWDDELSATLRAVLVELGVTRIYELGEFETPEEPCREIAVADFEARRYRIGDVLWTDGSNRWLVFVSHEHTVTITGEELLPALEAAWPTSRRWTMNYETSSHPRPGE